jgi:hypothetical protein
MFFVELATQYSCDAHNRECISADRPPSAQNGILLPGFSRWHFGVAYLCAYAVYLFITDAFVLRALICLESDDENSAP